MAISEVTSRPLFGDNAVSVMSIQAQLAPVARLDFVARGSTEPGWYIRYEIDGRPRSERLAIEIGADAFGAIGEAAEYLGCGIDQIEFGGPVWPKPLDGMVDEKGTLEYVTELLPRIDEGDGEWRTLTLEDPEKDPDARRFERREVEGVLLYGPVYGRILNWSESGMGIEIGQPLRLEARELFVAKGKRSKIELYGEVRWCRKVEAKSFDELPAYFAGVALVA